MAFMETGNPDCETLVLIHGISDSSRNWRTIMEQLQDKYHMYAVDLRGFGKTDKPSEYCYTATEYAADVKLFMDAMGIDQAYIAGHSMGSMVTQTISFQYPERVLGTILISTFAHMHETPETMDQALAEFAALDIPNMTDQQIQEAFIPDPNVLYDSEFLGGYIETVKGITGDIMVSAWRSMSINDNRNFLPHIEAPVMVIWGTEDEIFTKEYQDELREYLPDACYVTYEGISHDIITETPIQTAKDIDAFIESVSGACRQMQAS